jgi:RNA polymerase sigma factor (sigma-70 family)
MQALGVLIEAYWKPVYKYIRFRWNKSVPDAQELTQSFFAELIGNETLLRYDPARSRFRTYLRLCVDGFVCNEFKAEHRLKRQGSALHLDFETAEAEIPLHASQCRTFADEWFEQESTRSLFGLVVDQLREEYRCSPKHIHFRLFEMYDLEDSGCSYADLAAQFDLSISDVTNYLSSVRRQFRKIALRTLREMCGSEEEFQKEARQIFGIASL